MPSVSGKITLREINTAALAGKVGARSTLARAETVSVLLLGGSLSLIPAVAGMLSMTAAVVTNFDAVPTPKVMKSDGSVADAYVEFDFGSPKPEVWFTVEVFMPAAALDYWGTAPYFLEPVEADGVTWLDFISFNGPVLVWDDSYANSVVEPVADTWTKIEHHYTTSGLIEVYVDDVQVISTMEISGLDTSIVRLGQDFTNPAATPDPAAVCYFRNFKAGTTQGGTDLFTSDFSDLGAWTSVVGDVSLVEPF